MKARGKRKGIRAIKNNIESDLFVFMENVFDSRYCRGFNFERLCTECTPKIGRKKEDDQIKRVHFLAQHRRRPNFNFRPAIIGAIVQDFTTSTRSSSSRTIDSAKFTIDFNWCTLIYFYTSNIVFSKHYKSYPLFSSRFANFIIFKRIS